MNLLDLVSTFLVSIFSGGATGLIGVAVQRYFDTKKIKLDMEAEKQRMSHEIELRKIDSEIMEKEATVRVRVAEIGAQAEEAVADAQAFAASFSEPKPYSSDVVATKNQGWALILLDFIRGIVRPVLTVFLVALTTWIYVDAHNLMIREGFGISPDQAYKLTNTIVASILYLATTCVLWWFGTRNKQKPPKVKA